MPLFAAHEATIMKRFRTDLVPAVLAVLFVTSALEAGAVSAPDRRRRLADTSPEIGAEAPDFELVAVKWLMMSDAERAEAERKEKAPAAVPGAAKEQAASPDRAGHVRLSSFRGKMPVVFVLTSYT